MNRPIRRRTHRSSSVAILAAVAAAALAACGDSEPTEAEADMVGPGYLQEQLDAYLEENAEVFDAFKNRPLGFNGVPYVLLRILVEAYPDVWPADFLGFAPHPDDYDGRGQLKPESERTHKLPYGFAYEDPAMDPNKTTENVFFSCAACHTGRVIVKGKVQHLYGAPNTEVDTQMYTSLLMQTAAKLYDAEKKAVRTEAVVDILTRLQKKDPEWFYGGATAQERAANAARAKKQVAIVLAAKDKVIEGLVASAEKAKLLYYTLPSLSGSYVPKDGKNPPNNFGPRPGRMDAYGIAAGLVFLHSKRPDLSFFANLPEDHAFFQGLPATSTKEEKFTLAAQRLQATAKDWLPHEPAPIDIMSVFRAGDRFHAGWDANQGAEARVVASGTSAVADPTKVNLPMHAVMNDFLNDLPAPPYPFAIDKARAKKGKAIYQAECAYCHSERNETVYTLADMIDENTKTSVDGNRAAILSETSRLGLVALIRETCKGESWCTPEGDRDTADNEYLRKVRADKEKGYKADVLHGVWALAPYLHNGSVPTLWHLLYPEQRPAKFVRGNINYDQEKVGFVYDRAPQPGSYDNVHTSEFDTTLRGQSNGGHTFGENLSDTDKRSLLEYMKTL